MRNESSIYELVSPRVGCSGGGRPPESGCQIEAFKDPMTHRLFPAGLCERVDDGTYHGIPGIRIAHGRAWRRAIPMAEYELSKAPAVLDGVFRKLGHSNQLAFLLKRGESCRVVEKLGE